MSRDCTTILLALFTTGFLLYAWLKVEGLA